jgi:hypothetical protein
MSYVGGRARGDVLGDSASDAFLSTAVGKAAAAAAAAAASQLPAGFTLGDPTGDQWGASYYHGVKVQGVVAGAGGKQFWGLADGTLGPEWDPGTQAAIEAAANAAYGEFSGINVLRSASPAMLAILTDPEWIALEGQPVIFSQLSAGLQDKIKAVPDLFLQLTDAEALTAKAAATPPPAPGGPARYLVGGVEFLDSGQVLTVNGATVTGKTLTQEQVSRLAGGGALSASEFAAIAPPPPPPPPGGSTPTTAPQTTTTHAPDQPPVTSPVGPSGSSATANYPATTFAPPSMPSDVAAAPIAAPVPSEVLAAPSSSGALLALGGIGALIAFGAIAAHRPKPRR